MLLPLASYIGGPYLREDHQNLYSLDGDIVILYP